MKNTDNRAPTHHTTSDYLFDWFLFEIEFFKFGPRIDLSFGRRPIFGRDAEPMVLKAIVFVAVVVVVVVAVVVDVDAVLSCVVYRIATRRSRSVQSSKMRPGAIESMTADRNESLYSMIQRPVEWLLKKSVTAIPIIWVWRRVFRHERPLNIGF